MIQRSGSLRSRQRQQTRAEIVRTAFDLFGNHGYEKVSVEMIAGAVGISRGTFFNYFPKKELLLREIASARAEKLRTILDGFMASGATPSFAGIIQLMVDIAEENARISRRSKRLLLEVFFNQVSQGMLLTARQRAVDSMAGVIAKIPRRRKIAAKLIAETLFSVYIATMLEWLMRENVSQQRLLTTMQQRLELVVEGVS